MRLGNSKDLYGVNSVLIRVILSLFVATSSIVGLGVPRDAKAFSGGTGTTGDPYIITTCAELQSIGSEVDTNGKVYELSGDIDCTATSGWNSGAGFSPINYFQGTLNGNNHTIDGLFINRPTEDRVGLFASLSSDGVIARLKLTNVDITGQGFVGSLVGESAGNIVGASASGDVSGASGSEYYLGVGGLIGRRQDTRGSVTKSSFSGTVTNTGISTGGLIGFAGNTGLISNVYADAVVTGSHATGGLIGYLGSCCNTISNAYAIGSVTGGDYVGGLIGRVEDTASDNSIANVFAASAVSGSDAVGAVFGRLYNAGDTIISAAFDQTIATTASCYGTSDYTNNLTCTARNSDGSSPSYFFDNSNQPLASWDFDAVWSEQVGDYPLLIPAGPLTGPGAVTDLTVQEGSDPDSVEVTWSAPLSTGSFPLRHYRWEMKKTTDDWDTLFNSDNWTDPTFELSGLTLGAAYDIRVQVVTAYGVSGWVETTYTAPEPTIYTASTCEELQDLPNSGGTYLDTYQLANDIDCSGVENFESLDWGDSFAGIFDGQGYTISNLNILSVDSGDVGLFTETSSALLQNVKFNTPTILGTEDSYYCGALAGYTFNTSIFNVEVNDASITCRSTVGGIAGRYEGEDAGTAEVENVSVSGEIIADGQEVDYGWGPYIEGGYNAGGLFGQVDVVNENSVIISQSFSRAAVDADSSNVGGLIGRANTEIEDDTNTPTTLLIQDSYSAGSVTGGYNAGGIIGSMEAYNDGYDAVSEIEIENAYSSATVNADDSAGGIVGYMDDPNEEGEQYVLNNVFAAGSVTADSLDYALIGSDDGLGDGSLVINNSYFDQTVTGQTYASAYYDRIEEGVPIEFPDEVDGWTAVNTDGNDGDYFKNNSSNPPLNQWDFESIWQVNTDDFPTLLPVPENGNSGLPEDLNGDAIPDNEQPNIGGYFSDITGKIVAMDMGENCELTTDDLARESNLAVADAAYDYDHGLFDFAADCTVETTTIKLYYYDVSPDGFVARKFSTRTNGYFNLNDATIAQQSINGHNVTVVTYQLTDNSDLDMDLEVGSIEDPAGLARNVLGVPNTGLGSKK